MKEGTIVVKEQKDDPFLRTYHLTEEISRKPSVTFQRPFDRQKSLKEMEQLGTIGEVIVREIGDIPGVEYIVISPYSITAKIGEAFLWGDEGSRYSPSRIHHKIINILCQKVFFYPDEMMTTAVCNLVSIVEGKEAESRLSGLRK